MHSSLRYQYARRLAVGGMAEVLIAQQSGLAGFEKLVVVKRILPQLRQDGQFVQMFLNEARLASSLKHPNIVEIYDVHREDDDFFIVMEYLSGEDLRLILRRARKDEFQVPVGIGCRIIADAASALHHAHTAKDANGKPLGIVHRDVAPTNIFVTYDGTVKLVDFGVAKANTHNIYTRPGTLKGKYAYCSPEQVQHKPLDARSDVFSLGICLHEVLTGRRLFRGSSPADVLKAVMESRIPRPSQFNAAIPPELDALVAKALSRDRRKRFESAAKIRDALDAFLEDVRLNVGTHQISRWMQTVLAEQYEERLNLEHEVAVEARNTVITSPNSLPPAFAGSTHGGSSASSASSVGRGSAVSQLSQAQPQGRSTGLVILATVLVTLFVAGLAAAAFYLGRSGSPAGSPSVAGAAPNAISDAQVALYIQVSPSGAKLTIDGTEHGQRVGLNGLLIPVAPNVPVMIEVEKSGYQTIRRKLDSPSSGTKTVVFNLEEDRPPGAENARPKTSPKVRAARAPRRASRRSRSRRVTASNSASLALSFEPPNAKLVINGDALKGRSPLTVHNLDPGSAKIELIADGFRRLVRTTKLRGGKLHSLDLVMLPDSPNLTTLDVRSTPGGATIRVDGEERGTTPFAGIKLQNGEHRIELSLAGYTPVMRQVMAAEGKRHRLSLELEPTGLASTTNRMPKANVAADFRIPKGEAGSAQAGATAVGRCTSCHGVIASDKTAAQWKRFFRYGAHERYARLREHVTRKQLLDIKAHLLVGSADRPTSIVSGRR